MGKLPSPCLGVCKFRREGHCISCSMTKDQKALSKKIKKPGQQAAFLTLLIHQQRDLGRFPGWLRAYLRKCDKKGVTPPPMGQ